MPAILADRLCREFRTPVKQPGLGGSLRQLVRPEYKTYRAVQDVSFSIEPGELVGFLGPNGAGKTTTIKMLSGIIAVTSGNVQVLGHDPFRRSPEMLQRIALVAGNRQQLWWDLPASDSFEVLAEIYGVERQEARRRTKELCEVLQIGEQINVQVRKLSLGERMKCELVASLLHRPTVLFLDEPTIGLDIMSQSRIREFLGEYNRSEGCTMILTSHYMNDIEELCNRVILINQGRLAFDGSLSTLKDRFGNGRRLVLTFHHEVPEIDWASLGTGFHVDARKVTLEVPSTRIAEVCSHVLSRYEIEDLQVSEPDIEDVISTAFELPASHVSRETSQ